MPVDERGYYLEMPIEGPVPDGCVEYKLRELNAKVPERCDVCDGSGEKFTDFWGEGKGRLQPCKSCNGKGYVIR